MHYTSWKVEVIIAQIYSTYVNNFNFETGNFIFYGT